MLSADLLLDVGKPQPRRPRVSFEPVGGAHSKSAPGLGAHKPRGNLHDPVAHRRRGKAEVRGGRRRSKDKERLSMELPALRDTAGSRLSLAAASQGNRDDGGAWGHKNVLGDSMLWLRSSTPVFNPNNTVAARVEHSGWERSGPAAPAFLARKQQLAALQHVKLRRSLTPKEEARFAKLQTHLSGKTGWEKKGPRALGLSADARLLGMTTPGLEPILADELAPPSDANRPVPEPEPEPEPQPEQEQEQELDPEALPDLGPAPEPAPAATAAAAAAAAAVPAADSSAAPLGAEPEPEPEQELELEVPPTNSEISARSPAHGEGLSAAGRPVVLVGPSGSGKTALSKYLVHAYPDKFAVPVPCTTQPDKPDEEWEVFNLPEMQAQIESGWVAIHHLENGHVYGVTLSACEDVLDSGKSPVLTLPLREFARIRDGEGSDGRGEFTSNLPLAGDLWSLFTQIACEFSVASAQGAVCAGSASEAAGSN